MNSVPNHFALFGIEPRFALDLDALDAAYKRVQAQVHPDKFAASSAAEKRIAMQWAARANEALQTLKSPARRAAYLCELSGEPIRAESNTAMPREFLLRQLELREALDDARAEKGGAALRALAQDARSTREAVLGELTSALDTRRDYARGAMLVRQLMFIDKLADEIEHAQHALSTASSAPA